MKARTMTRCSGCGEQTFYIVEVGDEAGNLAWVCACGERPERVLMVDGGWRSANEAVADVLRHAYSPHREAAEGV